MCGCGKRGTTSLTGRSLDVYLAALELAPEQRHDYIKATEPQLLPVLAPLLNKHH